MGYDQSGEDGIRISSGNNQMQSTALGAAPIADIGRSSPAPAPSGEEVLYLNEENGNTECALQSPLYNPYLSTLPVFLTGLPS